MKVLIHSHWVVLLLMIAGTACMIFKPMIRAAHFLQNDLGDVLRTNMSSHCKSKKWWKGVFYYIFDQAIISSFRVWNQLAENDRKKKLSMRAFLTQLFYGLTDQPTTIIRTEEVVFDENSGVAPVQPTRSKTRSRSKIDFTKPFNPQSFGNAHYFARGEKRGNCVRCYQLKNKKQVKRFDFCSSCDVTYCKACFDEVHKKLFEVQ
mmetsp:Transcript_11589/g.14386  ORF Transcript_11589/g.14386 Transcript_11589/m.14386 type:complete len:205 (-) Transcript_11589:24-638(-)